MNRPGLYYNYIDYRVLHSACAVMSRQSSRSRRKVTVDNSKSAGDGDAGDQRKPSVFERLGGGGGGGGGGAMRRSYDESSEVSTRQASLQPL